MTGFIEKIFPLLENNQLSYRKVGGTDSAMPFESFLASFKMFKSVELGNIGQYTYYFKHKQDANAVMCVKISNGVLRATMGDHNYFEGRLP